MRRAFSLTFAHLEGWVANPLFRFLSRFVFGHYRTLESYARALGRRFNQEVTPVHQAE